MAQTRPIKGDIAANIDSHCGIIDMAVAAGAQVIVFPELSLTGYEPALAEALAVNPDDRRLDVFQQLADREKVVICVGAPTRADAGVCIGLLVFQPESDRRVYSKQILHPDETPFFVSGESSIRALGAGPVAALAICYEISVPEHAQRAEAAGADIYIASVAKFVGGIGRAEARLAVIAGDYGMPVLMANAVGEADGNTCAGQSAVWNRQGQLIGQLDGVSEGILIFDTESQEIFQAVI
ncbi:carbon-nitrogen hydrolase family protein [Microbulbifer magnicolonia]|uniref:carbon-nitrogen hydrolase family protein n=1 Tax=Microbulbifer magnicolonia TaxID=3109744 RepID=UPI002B40FFD4|nr:carbon-nitrogen hydrolase family protein [Microbulbifer sp. GG15]